MDSKSISNHFSTTTSAQTCEATTRPLCFISAQCTSGLVMQACCTWWPIHSQSPPFSLIYPHAFSISPFFSPFFTFFSKRGASASWWCIRLLLISSKPYALPEDHASSASSDWHIRTKFQSTPWHPILDGSVGKQVRAYGWPCPKKFVCGFFGRLKASMEHLSYGWQSPSDMTPTRAIPQRQTLISQVNKNIYGAHWESFL
jgi:hypothetical protein